MELLTSNSTGSVRRLWHEDREYFVAPLTSIISGVLPGSQGALYYPIDEMARNVSDWDGAPITVDHPYHPATGEPMSASDAGVLDRQGVGFLRNSRLNGERLQHQAWIDVALLQRVSPTIYNALKQCHEEGLCSPLEQSTGLFTHNEPATNGANHRGKSYTHTARDYKPDHLALLPDSIGACSVQDGCGLLVNEEDECDEETQTSPAAVKKGVQTAKASLLDRIRGVFNSSDEPKCPT